MNVDWMSCLEKLLENDKEKCLLSKAKSVELHHIENSNTVISSHIELVKVSKCAFDCLSISLSKLYLSCYLLLNVNHRHLVMLSL